MPNTPFVYILILNYNSSNETIELLDQLKNQIYNNFKVLVIDNNSSNSSKDKLKKNIPVSDVIINNKNLGYAGGNNIGIKLAIENNADLVWILNPDIRIEEDTLTNLVNKINGRSDIAALGTRICDRNDKDIIYSDGGFINIENGLKAYHNNYNKKVTETSEINDNLYEVDYANGSCILISVNALKKVGLLKEEFFLYFEETEWCLKAKRQNFKILVDRSTTVYHKKSKKGYTYYYYMARNRILLTKLLGKSINRSIGLELRSLLYYLIKLKLNIVAAKSTGIINGIFKRIKKDN